jgi:hypothetical protein
MKKPIYLLIPTLIFFSCSPKSRNSIAMPPVEPIPLEKAATLISNFLEKTNYNKLAKEVAIGGAFDRKAFEIPNNKMGVLFWFCHNTDNNSGYPNLFLALEHVNGFDTDNPPTSPVNEMKSPDYVFKYSKPETDFIAVMQYIQSHKEGNQINNKPNVTVAKAKEFVEGFKKLIASKGDCATDNCKYPESYFDGIKGGYMEAFLSKNPVMVRYYFGYDPKDAPNSIRVILIGTNSSGMNIVSTKFDGSILQKSVPPPPDN